MLKKYTVLFSWWALCTVMTSVHAAKENPHTRTLAGSCAACHGTNGRSQGGTPVLAGLDESYFVKRMLEYQQQTGSTDMMPQQARGLTPEEIVQLGKYFATQPRASPDLQHQSRLRSIRESKN